MTLADGKPGQTYTIRANTYEGGDKGRARARMDCLGLVEGEAVHVLSNTFSGIVIIVKGSRLAVSRAIAQGLEVI